MNNSLGFSLAILVLLGAIGAIWKTSTPPKRTQSAKPDQFQVADQVDIAVIGTKFHWTFRYPGPDGKLSTEDDVHSSRILRLPPHVKARFHITSEDYVYILGIPLNENESNSVNKDGEKIREIAVPAMTHFIEHGFTNAGTYDLMVDPLCGFQSLHDPRMGQIVVSSQHDYSRLYPAAQNHHEPSHDQHTL